MPLILILLSFVLVFGGFVELDSLPVLVAFGAGMTLQLLFGLSLACPRCGKSPYVIGPSFGPFGFVGMPWPEAICSRCGFDMRNGRLEPERKESGAGEGNRT
ncbi:MAG TPA: hypothetical protein VGG10_11475, partial [Rhizomicrobium sp.]